jgi:hypothetical protein
MFHVEHFSDFELVAKCPATCGALVVAAAANERTQHLPHLPMKSA